MYGADYDVGPVYVSLLKEAYTAQPSHLKPGPCAWWHSRPRDHAIGLRMYAVEGREVWCRLKISHRLLPFACVPRPVSLESLGCE
jgi:hypothetical protein